MKNLLYLLFAIVLFSCSNSEDSNTEGNVTNMARMFQNASAFNQPIGSWDVSKVTDMNSMFFGATSFNQNLSQWCVVNIRIGANNSGNYGFNGSTLSPNNRPIWGARAASCP
jgi:surface protein